MNDKYNKAHSDKEIYFKQIQDRQDKISDLKKDIRASERKLKQLAILDAEHEGYGKGACFRTHRDEVFCVVDHRISRRLFLDDFIICIYLVCRKVNKNGYLDKRSTETQERFLKGIEKILHENQEIEFNENINCW